MSSPGVFTVLITEYVGSILSIGHHLYEHNQTLHNREHVKPIIFQHAAIPLVYFTRVFIIDDATN